MADAWANGFWEVDVHRALRHQGDRLAMAEAARVTFAGGSGLRGIIGQRLRHGRIYGAGRARGIGVTGRVARTLRSPLVPPLLVARIVAALRGRRRPLGPWLPAFPALLTMATAWAIGEAAGAWITDETTPHATRHECVKVRA